MHSLSKFALLLCFLLSGSLVSAQPTSFSDAKYEARTYVYADRNDEGEFYCGCRWRWVGRSGGQTDLTSCGYQVRAQETRAARTEWEHVMPAWVMGHQRQCWQNGGRKNCTANDPVFEAMEADLHNLVPAIGEVNGDRSNYSYAEIPDAAPQYGACDAETDFKGRKFEPRDVVKGQIARIYFYMADRYDLRLSKQDQRLFMAWDKQHPVSPWERERDRRIAKRMGHSNPFVTGEKRWSLGHKNSRDGVVDRLPAAMQGNPGASETLAVRGNKNSKVYHLPQGCPSYEKVSQKNRVEFSNESHARAAGYRKAGNCS